MEMDGIMFPLPLQPYIPPMKPNAKPVTKSKDTKYGTFIPLFSESMRFTRETLGKILQLKFVDIDFNDKNQYTQFAPNKYLKQAYYPESGVTRLELQQWMAILAQLGLLNMLNVQHFSKSPRNTAYVRQLLMFVHDGCLWVGKRIPINPMLIWRIKRLPYQGLNPIEEFVGND